MKISVISILVIDIHLLYCNKSFGLKGFHLSEFQEKIIELTCLFIIFSVLYLLTDKYASHNYNWNWILFGSFVFTTIFKEDYESINVLNPFINILFSIVLLSKLKFN